MVPKKKEKANAECEGAVNGKENYEKNIDVDVLHENGITVNIQSPGIKLITIQLTNMELVQEIHQLLMDREETCHRTCFSLHLNGIVLDSFAEIKSIKGLRNNSTLYVVEEPYTMREARSHVRHVRGLFKSMDAADACNGVDCNSLTFLNTITQGDILEKKKSQPDSIDCTPPEYIMSSTKKPPLLPLQPNIIKNSKGLQALKVFTTSAWNPPPGSRKLLGDLLYLYVVTMEDKQYHITACPKGFYINQSTNEIFNPSRSNLGHLSHSVIDLLNQISPSFKRVFQHIQKKRTLRHAFERIPTPYQIFQWVAPQMDHTIDAIRAEDALSSKLGHEENIPGQTRDWNEELQAARELPRKALSDRLVRERTIFKVHAEFVVAATRGAIAIVDGDVISINPSDEQKIRMFIWNNIFFSRGFDLRDQYNELGGDVAAYVAPRNDLYGVRTYSSIDIDGLYTLGTVVIDYRGYRITAQSIIPGVLERDQEQSVVYGSLDFGKTVLSHPKYLELLRKAGKQLYILPHFVLNDRNKPVELCSSVECKGIIGNDGRYYILDLLRTFPPDVNFLKLNILDLSPQMKAMGFPLQHKHKLCCLRQELIDAFVEDRYITFVKCIATADESEATEITKLACSAVGSLKDNEFEINFNPDVFSTVIRHPLDDNNSLYKQRQLVQEAAEFLVLKQIPAFIKDHINHTSAPMDGASFSEALHTYGINLRYLGKVLIILTQIPRMNYLYRIGIMELIVRAAKHIYYIYIQNVDTMYLSIAISHFLNCFLSSSPIDINERLEKLQNIGIIGNKRGKNRNRKPGKNQRQQQQQQQKSSRHQTMGGLNSDNQDWSLLTSKILWQQINNETKSYWDYSIGCQSIEMVLQKYSLQRISILRGFCRKVGIQILLREYTFDATNKSTFTEEDILNVFPIVKHINPRASDSYHFYTMGQTKIQEGAFQEGYDLITEALNLLNSVFGAMHTENVSCLRTLARLSYLLGDPQSALAIQQRALIMSERVNGIDHPYTISEYTHLSLYCFANGLVSTSLQLLYRAKYLLVLIFGDDHPEIARIDSNINLILYAVGEHELALRFIEHAIQVNLKYFGSKSMQLAASYRLAARTQTSLGDFRSALNSEKETYYIYKTQLGEDHEKTRESADCLHLLTQQAVLIQRKMNDVHLNGALNTSIPPPLNFQPPSMESVLDMLNTINGVFFVQIRPKDIIKVKQEIDEHLKALKETNENIEILKGLAATDRDSSSSLIIMEDTEIDDQNNDHGQE